MLWLITPSAQASDFFCWPQKVLRCRVSQSAAERSSRGGCSQASHRKPVEPPAPSWTVSPIRGLTAWIMAWIGGRGV